MYFVLPIWTTFLYSASPRKSMKSMLIKCSRSYRKQGYKVDVRKSEFDVTKIKFLGLAVLKMELA